MPKLKKQKPKKQKFPNEVFVAMDLDGDLVVGQSAEAAYDQAKVDSREVLPMAVYKLDIPPVLYSEQLVVLPEKTKK